MDTYSVIYSPAARDDLFGVYTYIATELLGALVFHGYA